MTPEEKKIRDLTKEMIGLSNEVLAFLELMDRAMREPSTEARGKKIAGYLNSLEHTNDSVRYFVLGVDYRTDTKRPLVYQRPVKAKTQSE